MLILRYCIGLDWICLTTTHVLQDLLAVLPKCVCLKVALIFQINYSSPIIWFRSGGQLKLTNCIISDRRIPLLAWISLCKSREFSRREYSMSQLCSIRHDIPVTLHSRGAYGQCSVTTMVTSSRRSSGQDMGLCGLCMTNSKSGDYNLFSSGGPNVGFTR